MAFYFAYGDLMNAEKMAGSIPGARLVGPGRLDGYRLAFNVNSRAWGGGAANAVPDSRSSVWGVLWELGDDEMEHLEPINRGTPEQDHGVERCGTIHHAHESTSRIQCPVADVSSNRSCEIMKRRMPGARSERGWVR